MKKLLYTLIIFFWFMECEQQQFVNDKLNERLNQEERNRICCERGMRCCKRPENGHQIQMRALLVRCPNSNDATPTRHMKNNVPWTREQDIKNFQGFDEDEPTIRSEVTSCTRKLLVTMKIDNSGIINCKNQFVVIDHVYDPATEKSQRLLNPYVIRLKQTPATQTYPLKFINYVNSEAHEVIYNKHDRNYTGCHLDKNNPTCGLVTYNGKIIPYSQGFCCSCDALKNSKEQPESMVKNDDDSFIGYSDPAHLLDGIEGCTQNLKKDESSSFHKNKVKPKSTTFIPERENNTGSSELPNVDKLVKSILTNSNNKRSIEYDGFDSEDYDNSAAEENNDTNKCRTTESFEGNFGKHQLLTGGVQIRGGQNCADRYTPPNLDPDTYHESTHCLRFSEVWYGIYQLLKPSLEHSLTIQIFEKHHNELNDVRWREFTNGKPIELNLFSPSYANEEPTIALSYKPEQNKETSSVFSLNYHKMRVLIPEGGENCNKQKYPELNGGPAEYLVLPYDKINLDGDQCNLPGVGFEAFFKQPNRCSVPKGSCLANQPKKLWQHDRDSFKNGEKGCFFLKNYGNVPKDALKRNDTTGDLRLQLEYYGKFSSTVDIEVNADSNIILRPHAAAKITEVYVDSTGSTKTILTIKVINTGLISSRFYTKLNDCPADVPNALNNIESKPVLIPPQHVHAFTLEIEYILPSDIFHCSAEVLNLSNELIALRRIKIQKSDRCICTWHCLCGCIGSTGGLKCIPMSIEHYHAAGFQGALPIPITVVHNTHLDEMVSLSFYILLFILLTLLLLGCTKAIIGLCCSYTVGIWGLSILLDLPKKMSGYFESDLKERKVEYDEEGWPVHPDMKEIRVRNISRATEFCTNVVFFFTYPIVMVILLFRRICCPYYTYEILNEYTKSTSSASGRAEVSRSTDDEEEEDDECTCEDECPCSFKGNKIDEVSDDESEANESNQRVNVEGQNSLAGIEEIDEDIRQIIEETQIELSEHNADKTEIEDSHETIDSENTKLGEKHLRSK